VPFFALKTIQAGEKESLKEEDLWSESMPGRGGMGAVPNKVEREYI